MRINFFKMQILKINYNLIISAAIIAASLSVSFVLIARATSAEDIVYPVAELGNCKNETACRSYCDKPENIKACVNFAEKHNLLSDEELERGKKFAEIGTGPGGCKDQASCESYCNDVSRIDECLAFAEKNDFMSREELKEARAVQKALAQGAKLPGGCKNKKDCDVYCENPDNMEQCIAFGEAAGFIPQEELKEAKQVLEAMKRGVRPPPCRGREACDVYCSDPNNLEQCLAFAEAAGFMKPEEAEMARKTGGKGPGGCRGRECENFCEDEKNFQVCIDFAVEHDLIKPEEAEMARKTGGKGPGNCKGKEECEAFCQNPENEEVCFNFAKEHGLIPEEDLQRMEEGKQQMMEGFNNAPPEVMECLNASLGSELVEKLRSGTARPSRDLGDKMRSCFEQAMGDEMGPPEGFEGGPGMGFENMPPEVMECLRSTVGDEVLEKIKTGQAPPPSDVGDKMRSCFEQMGPMMEHEGEGGERFDQMRPEMRRPGERGDVREFESIMNSEGFIPSPDDIQRMMPDGVAPEVPEGMMPRMMPEEFRKMQRPPSTGEMEQFKERQMRETESRIRERMMPPQNSEMMNQNQEQMQRIEPMMREGMAPPIQMMPPAGYENMMPPAQMTPPQEQMQQMPQPTEPMMRQEPMMQPAPAPSGAEIQSSAPTLGEFFVGMFINLIKGAE